MNAGIPGCWPFLFFDVCFELRLPAGEHEALRKINMEKSWLGDPGSFEITEREGFEGDPLARVWLPDENFARNWQEYVKTGWVTDTTPPEAPYDLSYDSSGSMMIM